MTFYLPSKYGSSGTAYLENLKKRFEDGVDVKEAKKFELTFEPIIDPEDDQTIAAFDEGILEIRHSDIRELIVNPVPVILFDDDGEILFQGNMFDTKGCFPALPLPEEPPLSI